MDLTNVVRELGDDLALLVTLTAPAGLVLVLVRARVLRRRGSATAVADAVLEAGLLGWALAVASVTLTPKNYVELVPGSPVDWRWWSSDLSYEPHQTGSADP
ncbi:hypothetical protein [Nocardioides sp. J54]|uniref:hypothetical protein n=1 Tax=Nocardioides sp. J54 TaxID=935866 RepID=UPI00048AE2A4|nr:hypothetical protein [Nocardioides sp. J54]